MKTGLEVISHLKNSIRYRSISSKTATKNIFLLVSGKTVSVLGTSIYEYAIALYVLKITGSALGFAATIILNMLPGILISPFAGVLIDRFDRKKLIVCLDFLSGLTILILFFFSNFYGLKPLYIYITTLFLSSFTTFFGITLRASVPDIVQDRQLTRTNSLFNGIDSAANVIGPILGGIIYGFVNIKVFLFINGFSFIFSAIAESFIIFIRQNEKIKQALNCRSILRDLKTGADYLRRQRIILTLYSFITLVNFFIGVGIFIPLPYIVNEVIKLTPSQYGLIEGSAPLGLVASSIMLSILPEFKNRYVVVRISFFIITFVILLCGFPSILIGTVFSKLSSFIFYLVIYFIYGTTIVMVGVPVQTLVQRKIDDEFRGRVFGLFSTISLGAMPLGLLLSSFLITRLPPFVVTTASGLLLLLVVIRFSTNPIVKEL